MPSLRLCLLAALLLMPTGSHADTAPLFGSPVVYGLSQEAKTVAVGDLNGDGRDDVAVTAWPSTLAVLYQKADGSLAPPLELTTPNMPFGLAIGDLNGDSRMDLAVGCSGGAILLYRQQSDGSLGSPQRCSGYGVVNSLVIDDLNGDGLADIADTSATLPVVCVSLQAPDGSFGLPSLCRLGGYDARSLHALDYNSDGVRDLALLLDDQVCHLAGAATGGFEEPQYIPAEWAYALAAGDATGDGRDDLVFTVPESPPYCSIGLIAQTSDGLPGPTALYPAYAYAQALALADLDGDGRNDVVAAQAGYESVAVLRQNEDGTLGECTQYPAPYCNSYECGALAVGDLNFDGYPDLAIADWWNGLVVLPHTPGSIDPQPDTTTPQCSAALSGTMGRNGWYISNVTVTITAQDEEGGSGLSGITITLDGTTWLPYPQPLVVSNQGETWVGYYAEDVAGNRSPVQWVNVKLDSVPPVLSVQPLITTIWPPRGYVLDIPVSVTAADVVSGVAGLHLAVSDEYGLVQPETDVAPGSTVALPLEASRNEDDKDGRVYTIVLTGTDEAGNLASVASTVTVPHSGPKKPKKTK